MAKKLVLGLAIALALTLVPANSLADDEIVAILDTPEGVQFLRASDLVGIDHDQTCQGSGDVLDWHCSTGTHTRTLGLSHGFVAPFPNDSTVESRVMHGLQEGRVFACTFSAGAIVGCAGVGDFPPVGADFDHDCWSYVSGQNGIIPATAWLPTGIPGGDGQYTCQATLHGA